jgi:hypothetical protein
VGDLLPDVRRQIGVLALQPDQRCYARIRR